MLFMQKINFNNAKKINEIYYCSDIFFKTFWYFLYNVTRILIYKKKALLLFVFSALNQVGQTQ